MNIIILLIYLFTVNRKLPKHRLVGLKGEITRALGVVEEDKFTGNGQNTLLTFFLKIYLEPSKKRNKQLFSNRYYN